MTVEAALSLLIAFAAVTALVTEGVKSFLDSVKCKYITNVIVLVIALMVGCGGTAIYYVNAGVPFNALTSVYLALMGVFTWLCAMLGYDKVIQTIAQALKKG